jgi:hypothetical protein
MRRPVAVTITLAPEHVEVIAEHVAEIVRVKQAPPSPPSPYLTADEVAELIRCRRRRIYELVADGRRTRLGRGPAPPGQPGGGARVGVRRGDLALTHNRYPHVKAYWVKHTQTFTSGVVPS